ncbi:MAG: hypothetical protein GY809_04660, partial [Planctomycetes bacterium]|nr:hypothetical protein [Planctomycetota bacterium]
MTGRWMFCVLIAGLLATPGMAETEAKGNVWSNLDVQLYGYIKADASYDNSTVSAGNFARWVQSETNASGTNQAIKNNDQFNMTAKETRFGFKIKAPETGRYAVSGQMEWDMYGEDVYGNDPATANQNKPDLQTRHAFITIKDVDTGWSLLAGQTWDVVSPLNPRTLNYTPLWWVGNYGFRRPQIRLSKTYDMANGEALTVTGALARTIGGFNTWTGDAGASKGYPQLQGRVAWTFPLINGLGSTVGVSGHFGEEEYALSAGGPQDGETVKTWSTALDATVPVCENLSFQGELYRGANLSQMLGGIAHGVNTSLEEVHNYGGWVAAAIDPSNPWSYNTGYGFSRNEHGDLAASDRLANSCVFGNAIYDINKHASAGVEVSHWVTKYKSIADGRAWRGQLSLILK